MWNKINMIIALVYLESRGQMSRLSAMAGLNREAQKLTEAEHFGWVWLDEECMEACLKVHR